MSNPITKELLLDLIKYEKKALADDDQAGTCAAHHRGAIDAYQGLIGRIEWEEREEKLKEKQAKNASLHR
jgi:hypothetical protein